MIRIDIRPVWRFRLDEEREFDFRMVPLLEAIERTGKLTHAARETHVSYRHAWNLIDQWGRFFGSALVVMEKGKGTRLTDLGANLLWAAKRAQARLEPELHGLASEFARALNESLYACAPAMTVHASHDLALAQLLALATDAGITVEAQYRGSFESLAALRRGECELAGFHVPAGRFGELMARRYAECLPEDDYVALGFVTREQGFMVRAGNPLEIRGVADLARQGVRLVNRQRGSGTRALLEYLLSAGAIDRSRVRGYEWEESTHSAVAALIAGNQADVGVGIRAAAAQYRLGFVPLCTERYLLACRRVRLDDPVVAALRDTLASAALALAVGRLPGYALDHPGEILEMDTLGLAAAVAR
ncbi:MAG TPA: substrate-binding domain-containing protein [Usitatibacter sp.]|nr:substrate-binding domain-containing protein [Usitatibacter sp.]